jgi:hypothetical protein
VAFCGMQWRAIGQLCDIPFGTLYTLFARWTRLWRRLLNRLIHAWRRACGDTADPSAVIIDSRSCQSAPTCFTRGFDGGKKIKGIKIHLAVDKYGFPLAITVSAANRHDSKGIVPVLHQLAGFKGTALGDLSYRGQRLSKAGETLGITIQPSAGGHGGTFIPEGIRVERSLGWISRYRRLNTIFERTTSSLSSRSPSSPSCPAAWSALGPRKSAPDVYKQTLSVAPVMERARASASREWRSVSIQGQRMKPSKS